MQLKEKAMIISMKMVKVIKKGAYMCLISFVVQLFASMVLQFLSINLLQSVVLSW